jgi:hypothetical protein
MKIILANGTELNPINVIGESTFIQGARRDTLRFVFPASKDIVALDNAFTEESCENITIVANDGSVAVHKAYTVRVSLTKAPVEVKSATAESEAVMEDRITVAMAQRTYIETQLRALNARV